MNNVSLLFVARELQKAAAAGSAIMKLMGRAPTPMRGMSRLMGKPDFQEVLRASSSNFPRLSGLPVTNPITQRAIAAPRQTASYTSLSNLSPTQIPLARAQLSSARVPMARLIRGYRQLQRSGALQ